MRLRGVDDATQPIGNCDICGAPATTYIGDDFKENHRDGGPKRGRASSVRRFCDLHSPRRVLVESHGRPEKPRPRMNRKRS